MNYSSLYPTKWTFNRFIVFLLLHSYDIFEKSLDDLIQSTVQYVKVKWKEW